ncbi:MAG: neuromedin U [Bacteroidota bacterium]
MKNLTKSTLTVFALLFFTTVGFAQSEEDLAKAAQNPVANMYSFPLQNNTVFGVGPYERTQNILNVQPVIPIPIGSKINMINRIVMPIITQPSFTEDNSTTGVGDIVYTAWLSPSKPSKIIWGLGPVFQIPTATDCIFGSGEFGVGPSLVVLTMPGDFVIGAVVNNIRTFGDKEENKFFLNYFVNYNFPKWYLVSAPIITANWNADIDQRWVVPFGIGAGKIVKLGGKLPVNLNAHVYYNAVKPDGVGDWQTRFQIVFMLPTKAMKEKMKTAN